MGLFVLTIIGVSIVFIFFLVIARTLNSISNYTTKLEYWMSQELEFLIEQKEIRKALALEEAEDKKKKKLEERPIIKEEE